MKSVINLYSKYKFAVVFENSIAPGYVTEKLLLARLAGTIDMELRSCMSSSTQMHLLIVPHISESQTTSYARCLETLSV